MKSLILMASYNGEKYIGQQIESIIKQTYKNWSMVIRDDGSNDNTVNIIKGYCETDSRISLLQNNTDRHGAYLNFFTLIDYAKQSGAYDYYFFSDQDDIWLADKMEKMIRHAEQRCNKACPCLCYGDMQIIDKNGTIIYPSINSVMGIGEMSGMSLFFAHGYLWGCDVMLNKKLFNLVPVYPLDDPHINIMSHDNYFGKFCTLVGKIEYLNEPCIQHRRHDDNTTGFYDINLGPHKAFKRLVKQFDNIVQTHARVYNQTLFTIKQMEISGIHDERLADIEYAIHAGGRSAVRILRKYHVKRKQKLRSIAIYSIMYCKIYKKYLFHM